MRDCTSFRPLIARNDPITVLVELVEEFVNLIRSAGGYGGCLVGLLLLEPNEVLIYLVDPALELCRERHRVRLAQRQRDSIL